MDYHPIANIFPLMTEQEMDLLVNDIAAHGQREPALVFEGKILDGRNRAIACKRAGEKLKAKQFKGTRQQALEHVWSTNTVRRHLTSSQKAMITAERKATDPDFAEQCRLLEEEAKERKAQAKGKPRGEKASVTETIPEETSRAARETSTVLAKASGTNRKYLELAEQIFDEHPEYVEPVKQGEKTVTQANREIKKQAVAQKLETLAAAGAAATDGKYDVIVLDPPWPMQKIERDCRPNQVEFDYPTMTEEQLAALEIPCADDCHVWVWTTHRFLPMALRLLDKWGLKYVCTFVWHKPGGFQPVGLPQYNCEFAIYARKGSPPFLDTKDFGVCFSAPRGEHSEKPEAFYETLRRVTGGRRLDMFNRRKIEGFDGWGNEAK